MMRMSSMLGWEKSWRVEACGEIGGPGRVGSGGPGPAHVEGGERWWWWLDGVKVVVGGRNYIEVE